MGPGADSPGPFCRRSTGGRVRGRIGRGALAASQRREGMKVAETSPGIMMTEVTDPEELAQAQARHASYQLNVAWLRAHAAEVYRRHRGKCICIAGGELFVADTPEAVL